MKPLFEECFLRETTTTTPDIPTEPTDEPKKSRFWLILGIVITVVVIILVIIGCVLYWKCCRDQNEEKTWHISNLLDMISSSMKCELQTLFNCNSYDLLEPSLPSKSSDTTLKSSVSKVDAKTSVGSSRSVKTQKTMSVKSKKDMAVKTKKSMSVKTSTKLSNDSKKQKVSPKK